MAAQTPPTAGPTNGIGRLKDYFKRRAHDRDLPSFPTRRSSDLLVRHVGVCNYGTALLRDLLNTAGRTRAELSRSRSEEHTSELQSPVHLVCRLLLENK